MIQLQQNCLSYIFHGYSEKKKGVFIFERNVSMFWRNYVHFPAGNKEKLDYLSFFQARIELPPAHLRPVRNFISLISVKEGRVRLRVFLPFDVSPSKCCIGVHIM